MFDHFSSTQPCEDPLLLMGAKAWSPGDTPLEGQVLGLESGEVIA